MTNLNDLSEQEIKQNLLEQYKNFDIQIFETLSSTNDFAKELINNPDNVIALDANTHRLISAYYSRLYGETGMTFRNWLAGQDLVTQYNEGLRVLKMFGVNIP